MLKLNKSDFEKLVKLRLKESKILLDKKKYSGAYYLCGYIIEYALKAYFTKSIKKEEFPDKDVINKMYQHSPKGLVEASGLQQELKKQIAGDKIFETYWKVVTDWSEEARYTTFSNKEAGDLYKAITDSKHGVLRWIKKYW